MTTVVLYCRRGFERDAAAEISHHASLHGFSGSSQVQNNSGYVTFTCASLHEAENAIKQIDFKRLVFARQWFAGLLLQDLPVEDRIARIKERVHTFPLCGALSVECADTNDNKALSKLCSKISPPLTKALQKLNKLTRTPKQNRPVLHVMFLSGTSVYAGFSFANNHSPFERGIPRLKMPNDAPSRSTLKLDEACQLFLTDDIAQKRLRPGMSAVDLGACPGGWTYQLVRRGLFVSAVDNGEIQPELLQSGQVEHHRADGFKYRPKRSGYNTWLVCDMVEKPSRITALMLDWILGKDAKELIFNLKLPMKKRFETVYDCLNQINHKLTSNGFKYELQAKQLYHDREEITVYIHIESPE